MNDLYQIRSQRADLLSEYQRVSALPLTAAETKKRIEEAVKTRGQEFKERRVHVADFSNPDRDTGTGYDFLNRSTVDPIGLMCATNPKAAVDMLFAESEALRTDEGLTQSARAQALQSLADDLMAIEMDEERVICDLEASGAVVHRRADANPEIVLGFAV